RLTAYYRHPTYQKTKLDFSVNLLRVVIQIISFPPMFRYSSAMSKRPWPLAVVRAARQKSEIDNSVGKGNPHPGPASDKIAFGSAGAAQSAQRGAPAAGPSPKRAECL